MSNSYEASNGEEWHTAGKSKQRSKPAASQPVNDAKPQRQQGDQIRNGVASPRPNNTNVPTTTNGEARLNGGYSGNNSAPGRTNAGGGKPKTTTSNSSSTMQPSSMRNEPINKQLEKEIKNLERHDSSIARIERLFNEETAKSTDRVHRAFAEVRDALNQRERVMMEELDRCKTEGSAMLREREAGSKELHAACARAASMSDRQVGDLRDQIKRFLSQRHYEDDLTRKIRFQYEPDQIMDLVKRFGEVVPVGNPQKHSSLSSLVSSVEEEVPAEQNAKAVSQIAVGGIFIKSDSMNAEQLEMITRQLQENLRLQGIAEDILPDVSGMGGTMPVRRRPPTSSTSRGEAGNNRGRGGAARRGGNGSAKTIR